MTCPVCGYVFAELETECRRCARRVAQPCGSCGRPGVVAVCRECGREICGTCAVPVGDARLCAVCAPANLAARHKAELAAAGSSHPLPGPGFVAGVELPGDEGLWSHARRGFAFMREVLAMGFRDRDLLIPSLLSVICSMGLLVALLLLRSRRPSDAHMEYLDAHSFMASQIIIAVLAMILGWCTIVYFINYFFTGMTVHLINVHLRGRDAQLGSAFRDAVRNAGSLLLLAIASVGVALLTGLLRGGRRRYGLGDFVAGAVDRIWVVAVSMLLPIIMLEDVSLRKAMQRAREIHQRNLIPIGVAEIGVGLVNGLIGVPLVFLANAGVHYIRNSAPSLLVPMLVGLGIALALVMAFTGFVRTAYYTCLYLWAVERAEAKESAAVPRPLAVALGL